MNANQLSPEYRRRIVQSIEECDRFINKEQPRSEELRPQEMKDLLAFYISHRANLVSMLNQ